MRFAFFIFLCAGRIFAQGSYIGIGMQEISPQRSWALHLPEPSGIEITEIVPDSPAEKAGLKVGDAILKYNGQKVEGIAQFARLVRETPPGRDVKLDISRDGAMQQVTVRVAQRKMPRPDGNDGPMAIPFQLQIPDLSHSVPALRSAVLGVEAEAVDGQLAQYFGVKEGVLVRSVLKGSAAEKAGIRAGDVIVRIDDAHVTAPADISNRVRMLRGKSVQVALVRDHKELTLTATIEDVPGGVIQITPFQVHPNPNQP
ncbi:MAG TPA: PDZ domain-containing protein [Bryobacteraceae bacterium]|nr:PDZ domain-containing protein [Bryobacteraceae bacterium]